MEQAINKREPGRGSTTTDSAATDTDTRVELVHLAGWDSDYLRPRYMLVAILAFITFASPILCSNTGLADLAPAAFILFLAGTAITLGSVQRARHLRIVIDEHGLHRCSERVPAWLRSFARAWSIGWDELLRIDDRQIDIGRQHDMTTTELRFLCRDGTARAIRPCYWWTREQIDSRYSSQDHVMGPVAATPIGHAIRRFRPDIGS